jgi:hypothetical protein
MNQSQFSMGSIFRPAKRGPLHEPSAVPQFYSPLHPKAAPSRHADRTAPAARSDVSWGSSNGDRALGSENVWVLANDFTFDDARRRGSGRWRCRPFNDVTFHDAVLCLGALDFAFDDPFSRWHRSLCGPDGATHAARQARDREDRNKDEQDEHDGGD